MLEFLFDSARTVSDLVFCHTLTRYPEIRWVLTHGAGVLPLLADRMELFRTSLDGGLDGARGEPSVQEQLGQMWFDMAGTPFPRQVPAAIAAFGDQRLIYGSDYCWTPASAACKQVASIDAAQQPPGDSWRALTSRNTRRLFDRIDDSGRSRQYVH